MIIYSHPGMRIRFVLTDPVLQYIAEHRQFRIWHKEAGGQLFGTFDGDTTLVAQATGPRPTDRRSRHLYRPDPAAEQREIYAMHACGFHYVGDWHTHPQREPEPSDFDTSSMIECFRKSTHRLDNFLLIVAGTADFPDGLHVSIVSDGSKPLVLSEF